MDPKIKEYIDLLDQKISQLRFGEQPSELYDPIRYIMALGGKRMRPLLTLLAYHLFKDDIENALNPAVGVELFHNFTLMHDDIMDKAPLRRGEPTVHQKWGENVAILSGDTMMIKAYEFFLKVDDGILRSVMTSFSRCATEVCEGQQWDMNFQMNDQVSVKQYLQMIRQKTAALLGFSLELGAILANTDKNKQQALRDFGVDIGAGFQIKDDLLDVYADHEKFGKQKGGDIAANKKTFLMIKALELSDPDQKKVLDHWLSLKEFDTDEKVKQVKHVFDQLNIRELTETKMNEFFNHGFARLNELGLQESKLKPLKDYTDLLINRER